MVKMPVFPRLIYRFHAVIIKIPVGFFFPQKKSTAGYKVYMKMWRTYTSQNNFGNKNWRAYTTSSQVIVW